VEDMTTAVNKKLRKNSSKKKRKVLRKRSNKKKGGGLEPDVAVASTAEATGGFHDYKDVLKQYNEGKNPTCYCAKGEAEGGPNSRPHVKHIPLTGVDKYGRRHLVVNDDPLEKCECKKQGPGGKTAGGKSKRRTKRRTKRKSKRRTKRRSKRRTKRN
jgi:hypothetical protein